MDAKGLKDIGIENDKKMNQYHKHPPRMSISCVDFNCLFHNALLDLHSASKTLRHRRLKIKREAGDWFTKSFVLN